MVIRSINGQRRCRPRARLRDASRTRSQSKRRQNGRTPVFCLSTTHPNVVPGWWVVCVLRVAIVNLVLFPGCLPIAVCALHLRQVTLSVGDITRRPLARATSPSSGAHQYQVCCILIVAPCAPEPERYWPSSVCMHHASRPPLQSARLWLFRGCSYALSSVTSGCHLDLIYYASVGVALSPFWPCRYAFSSQLSFSAIFSTLPKKKGGLRMFGAEEQFAKMHSSCSPSPKRPCGVQYLIVQPNSTPTMDVEV